MDKEKLLKKIKKVPISPGIYLWKDINGNVLYVGKAKNLRNRMKQYFEGAINSYKTSKLVSLIADFETYICKTNKESLLLERNLIQKYNPEYNILLLDDKKYPYIKVKLNKNSLDISLSRKVKNSDANTYYFGPFPMGYGAKIVLKLLQHEAWFENGLKIKSDNEEFWKQKFNLVKDILSFKKPNYLKDLEVKMLKAAENYQYEVALIIKNSLTYLKKLKEEQIIELSQSNNIDVLVYKTDENAVFVTVLFYRNGILINKDNSFVPVNISINESLRFFMENYYENKIIPDYIYVEDKLMNLDLNLPDKYKFVVPKIGPYKKIIDLANMNLNDYYDREHLNAKNKTEKAQRMLKCLKRYVNVQSLKNIVIFDNSNINNTNPVGVAITYTNGLKNKSLYRKFNLSTNVERLADVEYMKQSITRFFTSARNETNYDLIIVDGGIQQVNEAYKTVEKINIDIPIIGLVKDENHKTRALINLNKDEVYFEEKELHNFVSEIQIEVDRFAKSHFRNRQKITSLEGQLTNIKGIGPSTEKRLLKHFKSYSNIYNATIEELEEVVSHNLALKIFNFKKK